jgi:hypothetical protein
MSDVLLNDAQFQKILSAIQSLKGGGIHWEQVIPVFFSALLAILVGMFLEYFRSSREKTKAHFERQIKELQQINGVVVGIGYNVEILLHATFQNLLPHHTESHAAYDALQATNREAQKIITFAASLSKYPALMMTCPEMYFVEFDFLEKLPFLIEKDAELVKKAGWMFRYSRVLDTAIKDRNKFINEANRTAYSNNGALSFFQLDSILQMQQSIADAECVNALQLFDVFLSIAKSLETVSTTYPIKDKNFPIKGKKLIPPPPLEEAMEKLRVISAKVISTMPAD